VLMLLCVVPPLLCSGLSCALLCGCDVTRVCQNMLPALVVLLCILECVVLFVLMVGVVVYCIGWYVMIRVAVVVVCIWCVVMLP